MTKEQTLEIELSLLLPEVEDEKDACIHRLETAFQNKRGILRAHIKYDEDPPLLCLHYDPEVITLNQVERIARRAGAKISSRYHHEVIPIKGMTSTDCALVLETSFSRMDGVQSVSVSYVNQTMHIDYDSWVVSRRAIEKRIRLLGYEVPRKGIRKWYQKNWELFFSVLSGVFLLIGWLGGIFLNFTPMVQNTFYIAAYFFGGYDITRHALRALRARHFDTDLLMILAALGAAILGQFGEGALLLFLFSLGHSLEERALDRARDAIRSLSEIAPKTAVVQRNGDEIEISVEQLQIDDIVIVRPGVRIPVDGEVIRGESTNDQSPITGESMPVDKAPGDKVFAGSINGEGALEVKVTKLAKDSTLARVAEMVEHAQAQKSPTQQMTERFTAWFVPFILISDFLLIIVPPLFGVPFADSFMRAMTLLVAASPCALALGTPSAILSGIARAARKGVLIKGGVHLENLGRIDTIAFDKTGTLTKGEPEVADVIPIGDHTADEVLTIAAALESRSAHPLAEAIVKAAQAKRLPLPEVSDTISVTGRGVQAKVGDSLTRIGNPQLFIENGIVIPTPVEKQVTQLESQGKTTMLVSLENKLIGIITVADTIRPGAKGTIAALKKLGVQNTIMLTGDNPRVAANIANQLNLTDYRASLMPEDKLDVIQELTDSKKIVAMVGDGVNDAPALANATVGIAMGGAGTDVALETADIALMADDLTGLPFTVGLGRATRRIIQQNLFIALSVIAVLVILATAGLAEIGLAIVFHEGSTIIVVLNALRLLGYKLKA